MEAEDIDQFFDLLKKNDSYFEALLQTAQKENKRLRIIATMEDNKVQIYLQSVDKSSPFYNLEGSDNMIVFSSIRYHKIYLVVIGLGDGAVLTEDGVIYVWY